MGSFHDNICTGSQNEPHMRMESHNFDELHSAVSSRPAQGPFRNFKTSDLPPSMYGCFCRLVQYRVILMIG